MNNNLINAMVFSFNNGLVNALYLPMHRTVVLVYLNILNFIFETKIPILEMTNIIIQSKFLLIPMNPPISDIMVRKPILNCDLVTSTVFSKYKTIPFVSILSSKPRSLIWYLTTLHGNKQFPVSAKLFVMPSIYTNKGTVRVCVCVSVTLLV